MNGRRKSVNFVVLTTAAGLLAACVPTQIGPTVQTSIGPGKTLDEYQADGVACRAFAAREVSGMQNASNQRAFDAIMTDDPSVNDVRANDHVLIQQQYDISFSQCMVTKGESVAGYAAAASPAGSAERAAPDPVIKAAQAELIRLGYLRGSADGYSGPRTRSAIVAFEKANGLPANGSASPRLLAKMQATPTSAPAAAPAATPANWVAPTTGPAAAPVAAAPSGWVAPK
jgi:hypothetical protein